MLGNLYSYGINSELALKGVDLVKGLEGRVEGDGKVFVDAVKGACLSTDKDGDVTNAEAYAKDPKKLETLLAPDDTGTREIFGGAEDIGDRNKPDEKKVELRMAWNEYARVFEDAVQAGCILAAAKAGNKGGDLDKMFASFGFDQTQPPGSLFNPAAGTKWDFKIAHLGTGKNADFLYHLQKVDQEFQRVNWIAEHGILLPGHSLKVLSDQLKNDGKEDESNTQALMDLLSEEGLDVTTQDGEDSFKHLQHGPIFWSSSIQDAEWWFGRKKISCNLGKKVDAGDIVKIRACADKVTGLGSGKGDVE